MFREFDIYGGVQKRWTVNVDEPRVRLRVTLAWDDAPGDPNINNYMRPKLVNDLDLYLISPSGKYLFYVGQCVLRALIGEIMWKYPYLPNMQTSEILPLGDYLEHYVTFGPEMSLGTGDHIYLYNEWNQLIGDYTRNSLAN